MFWTCFLFYSYLPSHFIVHFLTRHLQLGVHFVVITADKLLIVDCFRRSEKS